MDSKAKVMPPSQAYDGTLAANICAWLITKFQGNGEASAIPATVQLAFTVSGSGSQSGQGCRAQTDFIAKLGESGLYVLRVPQMP